MLLVTVFLATSLYAVEIGGVNVPESISAAGKTLVLNGAGARSKYMMKVYVVGLFLPQKNNNAQAILNADEPQAVRLIITSGLITSAKMEESVREGFQKSTNGNIAPIKSQIENFINVFKEPIKKGDVYELAYVPGKGVEVMKNGVAKSTVPGIEFKKALFGIWIGDKPAQDSLKKEMLGGK
ncbi:MAG TPA: chalcone isomerase family protein [Deltaproteobacteria bacterium]|nr:chalcone isomerase family protein [Deltaproteobacteria bacterium]